MTSYFVRPQKSTVKKKKKFIFLVINSSVKEHQLTYFFTKSIPFLGIFWHPIKFMCDFFSSLLGESDEFKKRIYCLCCFNRPWIITASRKYVWDSKNCRQQYIGISAMSEFWTCCFSLHNKHLMK